MEKKKLVLRVFEYKKECRVDIKNGKKSQISKGRWTDKTSCMIKYEPCANRALQMPHRPCQYNAWPTRVMGKACALTQLIISRRKAEIKHWVHMTWLQYALALDARSAVIHRLLMCQRVASYKYLCLINVRHLFFTELQELASLSGYHSLRHLWYQ